jgi:hypothetical protein
MAVRPRTNTRKLTAPQGANKPSNIGRTPTNAQKLIYIANKLGLKGISGMQGSSVNLYDTVLLSSVTGRQKLTFFEQTGNKSRNFTNFQNGTLGAGETLIMERVRFFLLQLSGGNDLTNDAQAVSEMYPISSIESTAVQFEDAFLMGTMNISIANQTVTKDYQIIESNPSYNRKTTGICPAVGLDDAGVPFPLTQTHGNNNIEIDAPPVLPPNQKFNITLEIPPVGTISANLAVMCVVGDFGSIFASKTTL